MIGETLGKYHITEHLGSGGMAEVYKAYQPSLDRYVAIKVLHSFLAAEENFLMRFQREARVVAMLRHPNIIQVYDFDFDREHGALYMVMEFFDGPSLKERLQDLAERGELLPLEEAARIAISISDALDYAHQRGMVHRDIKPANIMFGPEGQAILSDFGIARIVNVAGLTASGAIVGTPAYMAPEQGLGQAGDERSDIYSLGAVLYQLVTGQLPFDADTFMGVVLKHINEPPTPPSAINRNLPPGVEAVVLRAMAKQPDDRYQTARDFAADLRRAASSLLSREPPSVTTAELPALRDASDLGSAALTDERPLKASSPVSASPAPPEARRARRRLGWWLVALGVVALLIAVVVIRSLASGVTGRLLAALSPAAETALPPEASVLSATVDVVGTQVAAALATYVATTGVTPTPSPTATPTPTPSPTPDTTATALAACVYDLIVLTDEPVQPQSLRPGQSFVKRWEVQAVGTCAWPADTELVNTSGDRLELEQEPQIISLAPGESAQLELALRAPNASGSYLSIWQLQGKGRAIGEELTVSMRVAPPPTAQVAPVVTPTLSPTPVALPTATSPPTETLHFSVPLVVECRELEGGKWWARVGFTAYGGYGNYRYYQNEVSSETEFFNGTFEFEWEMDKAWSGTIIVTSGVLEARWQGSLPMPDGCD